MKSFREYLNKGKESELLTEAAPSKIVSKFSNQLKKSKK